MLYSFVWYINPHGSICSSMHAIDMKVCVNSLDHTELDLLHTCEKERFCDNLSSFFVVVSLCRLDVILSSKKNCHFLNIHLNYYLNYYIRVFHVLFFNFFSLEWWKYNKIEIESRQINWRLVVVVTDLLLWSRLKFEGANIELFSNWTLAYVAGIQRGVWNSGVWDCEGIGKEWFGRTTNCKLQPHSLISIVKLAKLIVAIYLL